MSNKCWIHSSKTTEGEEEKKSKSLKTHPGFSDNFADYQQNLAMILTPNDEKKQAAEKQELQKKVQKWQANYQYLAQEIIKSNETIKKIRGELIIAGSKNFYFVNQQLNKDIAKIRELVLNLQENLAHETFNKEYYQRELKKALEYLNRPVKEIETQTDLEWREMDDLETKTQFLNENELELAQIKDLYAKLSPYFQKLGITKTWQFFNEICLDYFASLEKDQGDV